MKHDELVKRNSSVTQLQRGEHKSGRVPSKILELTTPAAIWSLFPKPSPVTHSSFLCPQQSTPNQPYSSTPPNRSQYHAGKRQCHGGSVASRYSIVRADICLRTPRSAFQIKFKTWKCKYVMNLGTWEGILANLRLNSYPINCFPLKS